MFKIRDKETGMFSLGGIRPRFSDEGKIFKKRGHVTSHLAQLSESDKRKYYTDCEVVEYEIVEKDFLGDVLSWKPLPSTIRAKELEEQRKLEWMKEQREREIEKLTNQLQKLKNM